MVTTRFKRSIKAKAASRRALIAEFMLKGCTSTNMLVAALADNGVQASAATVAKDVGLVLRDWRASSIRDLGLARMAECEKISQVEREAWKAWELSKRDFKRTRKRKTVVYDQDDGSEGEEIQTDVEQRDGDPRFMQLILDCIKRRCALLGLDADQMAEGEDVGDRFGNTEIIVELATIVDRLRERSTAKETGTPGDVPLLPPAPDGGCWIESRPLASQPPPE